jgi:hypothetical protein
MNRCKTSCGEIGIEKMEREIGTWMFEESG